MNLQQATQCALLATIHLASRPDEQITAPQLAEIYGVSQHHLAKVLRTLSRAGIVDSTRGVRGGCTFSGDQRKVTLYDIIVLFEPDWPDRGSRSVANQATDVATELDHVLSEVDRLTSATLQSVTLQTVISNAARNAKKTLQKSEPLSHTG